MGVAERAVGIQRQRAVRDIDDQRDRDRCIAKSGVVGEDGIGRTVERRRRATFGHRDRVRVGDRRRVTDRRDRDRDRRIRCLAIVVGDAVREAIREVLAAVVGVAEGAVGVQRQ